MNEPTTLSVESAPAVAVQREAAAHARQTGHRVSAELGYAITYSSNVRS